MLDSELKKEIKEYGVSMRRHFHQNPELGGQEFETAKRIEAELDLLGIEHERVGDTNVISTIQGKRDGKIIGLRADIDALPVQEESGVAYQSKIPGIMHACGHDGHTAALLSAAKILTARKDEIAGTVKLLFQSAEELGLGAKAIVGSGEIDNLDGLLGIHIWNDVDSGKLYIGSGEQMASPVEFRISLEGKGGHGSASHQATDTIVPLASLIMNLQSLVSMEFNPMSDVVLTIGRIFSGENEEVRLGECYNIVSGRAYLEGTLRTFNDEDTERFREKILRMVKGIEMLYGVKSELFFETRVPAVYNDPELANIGCETCVELWGEASLDKELGKCMASEDFAEYCKKTPSMMAFVGGRYEEKLKCYPHHNSRFNFDEDAIDQAAWFYAQFAIDYLNKKGR